MITLFEVIIMAFKFDGILIHITKFVEVNFLETMVLCRFFQNTIKEIAAIK